MSHIKSVTPGTAGTIKLGSTTVRVLEDGRLTDNRIGAIVCTVPAQTKPLPQHLHRTTRHFWLFRASSDSR